MASSSSSSDSGATPPALPLIEALLASPTKSLTPTAARRLLHKYITTNSNNNDETDPLRLLLEEQAAASPVLSVGADGAVRFRSTLAERYAYADVMMRRGVRPEVALHRLVAVMAGPRSEDGSDDGSGSSGRGRGLLGGRPVLSTLLLAASALLYLAATKGSGTDGSSGGSGGGGYRGAYVAFPKTVDEAKADLEAVGRAARGALDATAAITRDTARAVAGQLAAASHAVGETLTAAAATAASHASPQKRAGGRRLGGGDGSSSTQV